MARGGHRAGAGRPKGARNRAKFKVSARVLAEGLLPLDILLQSMRALFERGDFEAAAVAAAKAAPFIHQKFAPTRDAAVKHPAQAVQPDLFHQDAAGAAAETAEGKSSDSWDGLLS
jgi:hypothetical protein